MPVTHDFVNPQSDSGDATIVNASDWNDPHVGTNDHAHTTTGDGGALNGPMTTAGDLIVGGASGVAARLAKGSDSQVLTVDPTTHLLVWATPAAGASFAAPTVALGSSAAAGAASTTIRSDATIAAFDATAPSTQAFGDSAAVGSAAFAARRDHKHAMMALPAIDATGAATDITTRNVSTSAHGLAPKLPNDATKFLDGSGAWTVPPAASGMSDPMTTRGDIIVRDASNVTARLAVGAAGRLLTSDGTDVAWTAPAGGGDVQYAEAVRTAGNITTTSTTFVDATSMSVTLTTGAHRCKVIVVANGFPGANDQTMSLDIAIDGTRQGGTLGLAFVNLATPMPLSFVLYTPVLSAGSHTIKLQWKVASSTGTLFASTTTGPLILQVIETSLTS